MLMNMVECDEELETFLYKIGEVNLVSFKHGEL